MAQNTTQGTKGALYAGNFIMQANAPLDDRSVVASKNKLLEFDNYIYPGMLVVTLDTNELYQLTDITKKADSDYSGWKRVGTDPETISGLQNDISDLREKVIENEETVSTALNQINSQLGSLEERSLNQYEVTASSGDSLVIPRADHQCGLHPTITVYYKNVMVFSDLEVNDSGDITVSWAEKINETSPLRIVIVGKNV